jgi:hypothetical protein
MPKLSPSNRLLFSLFLCLGAANLRAQQPDMKAPPLPPFSTALPPDPDSLPRPSPLEWEALGTSTPPQPEAADSVPMPPPVVALFVSGLPDPQPFVMATPWVEIWRPGAQEPEFITQTKNGPERVLIPIATPVLVRLLFDPSLTGTPITVKTSKEVILQPAVEAIDIGPGGECLFQVQLDEQSQGEVTFDSQGVVTLLPLQSAPVEIIEAMP